MTMMMRPRRSFQLGDRIPNSPQLLVGERGANLFKVNRTSSECFGLSCGNKLKEVMADANDFNSNLVAAMMRTTRGVEELLVHHRNGPDLQL